MARRDEVLKENTALITGKAFYGFNDVIVDKNAFPYLPTYSALALLCLWVICFILLSYV